MAELTTNAQSGKYEKKTITIVVQEADIWGHMSLVERQIEVFVPVEVSPEVANEKGEVKFDPNHIKQKADTLLDVDPKNCPLVEKYLEQLRSGTILEKQTGMNNLLLAAIKNPKILSQRFDYGNEETRTLGFLVAKHAIDNVSDGGEAVIGHLRKIYDSGNVTPNERVNFYKHVTEMLVKATESEIGRPSKSFKLAALFGKNGKLKGPAEAYVGLLADIITDEKTRDCFINEKGEYTDTAKNIMKMVEKNDVLRAVLLRRGILKPDGKKGFALNIPEAATRPVDAQPQAPVKAHTDGVG